MKTRQQIKEKAVDLFNQQGVNHVTLRQVASELDRSYGNITYYFSTKEKLISELYDDMHRELIDIGSALITEEDLLIKYLKAPAVTFDLSVRYLFLWKDYLEILRMYPDLARKVRENNTARKERLSAGLKSLQSQEYLRADLDDEDLNFLMDTSGAIRLQYFFFYDPKVAEPVTERDFFEKQVNRLLKPYLTVKGREIYDAYSGNSGDS